MAYTLDGELTRELAVELVALTMIFDVRVGVVTADLGSGPYTVPTCTNDAGDNAELQSQLSPTCLGNGAFVDVDVDADALAADLKCRLPPPREQCGIEQPLEAMLQAITPSSSLLRFYGGSGQEDRANAGFLRAGSLLAVLVMTQKNDCSQRDRSLFEPDSRTYTGDLGLRCFRYPGALQPIDRYATGLLAVRDPHNLAFFVVGGVPNDVVGAAYDDVLTDPGMIEHTDPDLPLRLAPSCSVLGRTLQFAPRRQIETAAALEASGVATGYGSGCTAEVLMLFERFGEVVRQAASHCCP